MCEGRWGLAPYRSYYYYHAVALSLLRFADSATVYPLISRLAAIPHALRQARTTYGQSLSQIATALYAWLLVSHSMSGYTPGYFPRTQGSLKWSYHAMHRPLVWTLNAFAIAIYTRLIKHDSDMPTTMQRKATHCA